MEDSNQLNKEENTLPKSGGYYFYDCSLIIGSS